LAPRTLEQQRVDAKIQGKDVLDQREATHHGDHDRE
jgi:hypothetical protein